MFAHFPTEVLVRIFTFYLDPLSLIHVRIREQRQRLAGISRHWRDIILHTPALWKDIVVTRHESRHFLKTQLKRSCEVPLNIKITASWHALSAALAIILPSANRWNSLIIDDSSLASFISLTNHLKFPSLRYVDIYGDRGVWDVDFISATRSPALENLDLHRTYDLPKLSQLKTLSIRCTSGLSPSFFVQSLTTLVLRGDIEGWSLERDSISLPVLQTLNLYLTKAGHFMKAIIAPRLEYFDYSSKAPDSVEFGGLRNKFSTVHHLSLLDQEDATCGMALCEALPGIRCVEIRADSVLKFAQPQRSGSQGYPLGDFHNLELLTIDFSRGELSLDEVLHDLDPLVQWLTERMESKRGRLRVRLAKFHHHSKHCENNFTTMYNRFRKCCILELDHNRMVTVLCEHILNCDSKYEYDG
ncbi:hypothetical protein V8B97DRAFT_227534 [Scleroderma yunnanense]